MKVAIIQITSVLDPQQNMQKIAGLIDQAKAEGAKHIFLPEVFYSMSEATSATPYLIKEGNEHYQSIQKLARDKGVFLLGGSAATDLDGKVINRLYNFDPEGKELTSYDKIHLFACDLSRHEAVR
jgi:predicted amidohydrolase